MAHEGRVKYSEMVLQKMNKKLVTKDNFIFNTDYEGDPISGSVKVHVAGDVTVADYDAVNGIEATQGSTTYVDVLVTKDKAINEIIDGWDAVSVPGDLVATRLHRAGTALATTLDADGLNVLATEGTVLDNTTALTKSTAYEAIVDAFTTQSEADITVENRYVIVKPAVYAMLLKSSDFIKQSALSQEMVAKGVIGQIAGYNVLISNNMPANVEFIAGHADCATRINAWKKPVKLVDLDGSSKYVGACAVKGRMKYDHKVMIPAGIIVKTVG